MTDENIKKNFVCFLEKMMNNDPHAYTISIQRVEIDGELYYEATVLELPDVADYGETYEEAYELAIDTIINTASALEEAGRKIPPPLRRQKEYSGRVTLLGAWHE